MNFQLMIKFMKNVIKLKNLFANKIYTQNKSKFLSRDPTADEKIANVCQSSLFLSKKSPSQSSIFFIFTKSSFPK